MLMKYTNYIKESNESGPKYKKGDKIIFTPLPSRNYYNFHKGSECKVMFVYQYNTSKGKQNYSIQTPSGATIIAMEEEMRYPNEQEPEFANDRKIEISSPHNSPTPPKDVEKPVENQTIFAVGTRVNVNGSDERISFDNRKGTITKSAVNGSLVRFDDDDSKNLSSETMFVDNKFITSLEDQTGAKLIFKLGDKVKCVDKQSQFYNQDGIIDNVWIEDNTYMVKFTESSGVSTIFMRPDQIKIVEYAKTKQNEPSEFTNIPVGTNKKTVEVGGEEEEEEDEIGAGIISSAGAPFKKDDLLEFSYKDFLLEEKITSYEQLKNLKSKYESLINEDMPKIKKAFAERTLRSLEIIESYFDFLINKVSGELPVYRTVEQIENRDLLKTKTKIKASESKELTRKHSFDQGIIAYWKFKDAVVFKTI